MQKPKPLSELLAIPSKALRDLSSRLEQRSQVLEQVRSALPPKLAGQVLSAGIDQGRLSIGVSSAVWASRLRYSTAILRKSVGDSLKINILRVQIRIVPRI
jgi:hypothetical protein